MTDRNVITFFSLFERIGAPMSFIKTMSLLTKIVSALFRFEKDGTPDAYGLMVRRYPFLLKIVEQEVEARAKDIIERQAILAQEQIEELTITFSEVHNKLDNYAKELEEEVSKRTKTINNQQIILLNASKMSALGEMAGGIAHEINTPLAIIGMKIEQLNECIEENDLNTEDLKSSLEVINKTTKRIAKIISGLHFFARDGSTLPVVRVNLDTIIEETLSFCSEKMHISNIKLTVNRKYLNEKVFLDCRAVEISQVLLNLLNNASDAISALAEKWIQLNIIENDDSIEINIIDSGTGIPKELQDKIMQPFFTTKEVGKGTGLGLSISRGIIDSHVGKFFIDVNSANTKFVITLPKS